MGKLKSPKHSPKLGRPEQGAGKGGSCAQFPAFSFRHLTTQKDYSLKYCAGLKANGDKTVTNILHRLVEIGEQDWVHWLLQRKKNGCETIDFCRVRVRPKGINLVADETVFVFRFLMHTKKDGRILGIKKQDCPTFFVIGFDFDYSAYDHGK